MIDSHQLFTEIDEQLTDCVQVPCYFDSFVKILVSDNLFPFPHIPGGRAASPLETASTAATTNYPG